MLPPTTVDSNLNCSSPFGSIGSNLTLQWPYCPRPPDCLAYLLSTSTALVNVSLYATWGAPTLASTLNSRRSLSTITSKWSSPIPAMIVWPVSVSVWARNVGSSSANLAKASPILPWSFFVLGSIASSITGSGNSIDSRITGCCSSQIVSPVVVILKPTAAAISPEYTLSISVRLLACICTIRPTRSFLFFVAFKTYEPEFIVPE